jgi:hypothetical protein
MCQLLFLCVGRCCDVTNRIASIVTRVMMLLCTCATMAALVLCVSVAIGAKDRLAAVTDSWYERLVHTQNFTLGAVDEEKESIHAVSIGSPSARFTVMVVCGMHPREQITVAICERWKSMLFGTTAGDDRENQRADYLLETLGLRNHFEIVIISNANPLGSAYMQITNNTCWRGNARGVDLNRNWPLAPHLRECASVASQDDAHSPRAKRMEKAYSAGEKPFSEPETRALDLALMYYSPHMLLSVHSGTTAIMTPYDSCSDMSPLNYNHLVQVAKWLRPGEWCQVGNSAQLAGYHANGTLVDYAYAQLGVPLAYTLEVYEPPEHINNTTTDTDCSAAFQPDDDDDDDDDALRHAISAWDSTLLRLVFATEQDVAMLHAMVQWYHSYAATPREKKKE